MAEVNEFEALDNPEEIRAEAETDDGAGVGADGEKLADAQAVSLSWAGLTSCCWSPLANPCPQRFPQSAAGLASHPSASPTLLLAAVKRL